MPKIAFLIDTTLDFIGGAELSNLAIIQKGNDLGFEITQDNLEDYKVTKHLIKSSDLVILNGLVNCNYEFRLIDWLIKSRKPYVRWEHDYGFCTRRSVYCFTDPKLGNCCNATRYHAYQKLYANSSLNIFNSPFHLKIHHEFYGNALEPALVLPPPIRVDKIRVKDKKEGTVAFVGRLNKMKGADEFYQYVVSQPDAAFFICGENQIRKNLPDNVHVLGEIPHEEVLELLGWCQKFFFKPFWTEPSGRAAMEAFLSGCQMIVNNRVGITSFDFYPHDLPKAKNAVAESPALFWDHIRKVLQNQLSYSPKVYRKVLIKKSYGGIGDYLLALPALKRTAEVYPNAEVAAPEAMVELLKNANVLPNLISDKEAEGKCINEKKYDRIIDFYNYPSKIGNDEGPTIRLKYPTYQRIPQHASKHYMDAALRLSSKIDTQCDAYPYLNLDTSEYPLIKNYFTIHQGAGLKKKCWSTESFSELLVRLHKVFPHLTGKIIMGKNDQKLLIDGSNGLETVVGKPLLQVAKILKNAVFHVGNDSGISHLAGALNTPLVVIHGPTGPGTWSPLASQKEVVYGKRDCHKPCNYHEVTSCTNQVCLTSITVDEVLASIMKLVNRMYHHDFVFHDDTKTNTPIVYLNPCVEIRKESENEFVLKNTVNEKTLLVHGSITELCDFLQGLKSGINSSELPISNRDILKVLKLLYSEEFVFVIPLMFG